MERFRLDESAVQRTSLANPLAQEIFCPWQRDRTGKCPHEQRLVSSIYCTACRDDRVPERKDKIRHARGRVDRNRTAEWHCADRRGRVCQYRAQSLLSWLVCFNSKLKRCARCGGEPLRLAFGGRAMKIIGIDGIQTLLTPTSQSIPQVETPTEAVS